MTNVDEQWRAKEKVTFFDFKFNLFILEIRIIFNYNQINNSSSNSSSFIYCIEIKKSPSSTRN